MESYDIIEESLIELDPVMEEEGLIPLEPQKIVEILESITADEVVNTFSNLLSDPSALSDAILKIHYVKELLDSAFEVSEDVNFDLISVLNALQHVSTNSVKFLTPQDIKFLLDSIYSSSDLSPASKLEHIKSWKENFRSQISDHKVREEEVLKRMLKLEAHASNVKATIMDHVRNHPSLQTTTPVPMAFNKQAEMKIEQLDFDGAVQALNSEVLKLEKMLVYERLEEEEFETTSLLNELLLSQIEAAEESRVFADRTASDITAYSATLHRESRAQQLERALARANELHTSFAAGYLQAHNSFETQNIDLLKQRDTQLDEESAKLISTLRVISADSSRELEYHSNNLQKIHRLRSKAIHATVDEVLDELHGQVTSDTGILAKNFSKIYESAELLLKENRANVVSGSGKKEALQTSVENSFSRIHETQEACSIDRADDFSLLLGKILDEQESECSEFLKKSDLAYEKFRKIMLERMLDARKSTGPR